MVVTIVRPRGSITSMTVILVAVVPLVFGLFAVAMEKMESAVLDL